MVLLTTMNNYKHRQGRDPLHFVNLVLKYAKPIILIAECVILMFK